MSRSVAVVGATGAVGRVMREILAEREFPVDAIRLLASARSAGSRLETPWGEVVVEDLATADPEGIDIALFSAGGDRSREFAPRFAAAGAVVIDNSSAFRMDDDVPLVVAGVNDEAIGGHRGIVANPNCTTMTLLMGVAPLHRAATLQRMVVSSYQAVSGSGQRGIAELTHQNEILSKDLEALVDGGWSDPGADLYVRPIGWNVVPFAGAEALDGYTDEELKLVNETHKILEAPDVGVEATCVRVPVMTGHAISATMWFERPIEVEEAAGLIDDSAGVEFWVDTVPTPLDSVGIDDVLVGRLRPTLGIPGGISFWTVGDNLRKGAALNAVQLAELLL